MKKICKHCGVEHVLPGSSCRVCKDGLYRYQLNRLDMVALLESQNKQCALCDKELEMFAGRHGGFVDHCHTTGRVRGILCNRCNTVVGGLENADLQRLLKYIEKT